jgi:DNA-binding response OmpR family regulator
MISKDPNSSVSAVIVASNAQAARPASSVCRLHGITDRVFSDGPTAVQESKDAPPALLIVEDDLKPLSGPEIITEFLKLSWQVSSILVSPDDGETVHEKTEGMGILGHVAGWDDRNGLEQLVRTFWDLRP